MARSDSDAAGGEAVGGGGRALPDGLHRGLEPLLAGAPLGPGTVALVLVHGRGASPEDMHALWHALALPGTSLIAPRARNATWYPQRFTAPLEANQPWLDSALGAVGDALALAAAHGVPAERTVLGGFSQGACLACEYVARNPRRLGALVGLSGGVIGPDDVPRAATGDLAGTPVFLGCSDIDPHIPRGRVEATRDLLEALGAVVDARIYRGMGHTVNDDEVRAVRALVHALLPGERDAGGRLGG